MPPSRVVTAARFFIDHFLRPLGITSCCRLRKSTCSCWIAAAVPLGWISYEPAGRSPPVLIDTTPAGEGGGGLGPGGGVWPGGGGGKAVAEQYTASVPIKLTP